MTTQHPEPIVFVHGWSVRDTVAYGELPERLLAEAQARPGLNLDARHLWLSKYVSFHDEVQIADLAQAFDAAIKRELGDWLAAGRRFVCVTHSAGSVIVCEWLQRQHHSHPDDKLPLSHLIMLAPSLYGSALAQVGKTDTSRQKAKFEGVEPGRGILDWLELGSPESLALNRRWIDSGKNIIGPHGVFPFVLQGESIDRTQYNHLEPCTGENGSDGVVRVASANPNTSWLTLEQCDIIPAPETPWGVAAPELALTAHDKIDGIAMRLIAGRAHSGDTIGIMHSIKNDGQPDATVDAIMRCLAVQTRKDYNDLTQQFATESEQVQQNEQIEYIDNGGPFKQTLIHDPAAMIIFRVRDNTGHPVDHFDLKLIADENNSPNHLPPGFFIDRQYNNRRPNTVTYYLNHARITGAKAVQHNNKKLRGTLKPSPGLGISITPLPLSGFVHYLPAIWPANKANMERLLQPNQTTVVDIVLRRVVGSDTFELTQNHEPENFADVQPGQPIRPK